MLGWLVIIKSCLTMYNITNTYSGSTTTESWLSFTVRNTWQSRFGLGTERKTASA